MIKKVNIQSLPSQQWFAACENKMHILSICHGPTTLWQQTDQMFNYFVYCCQCVEVFELRIDASISVTACVHNRQVCKLFSSFVNTCINQPLYFRIVTLALCLLFCSARLTAIQTKVHTAKVATKCTQEYTGHS